VVTLFDKHPLPSRYLSGLRPRGGPTVKKLALWLILGRGQHERGPTRQSGAFAKIAYQAIFKRSALPLGEIRKRVK
jgi:hypothetical protein